MQKLNYSVLFFDVSGYDKKITGEVCDQWNGMNAYLLKLGSKYSE